ncbi:MAG: hypothetical protein K8F91_01860, partial [Candidatus Obscuribacterales bacterium]|nr:hypothetical protein [Candidatus Obscuribacterales bacterium]
PSLIKKRDAEEERTFEDERKRQRLADEEQLKRDLEDESDRVLDLGERLRDEFCELVPEDGDSEPAGSFGVLYERANVHHGLKAELEGLAFGVQSGQIDWKIAQDELAVIEEKVASVQSVNEHRQSQLYRYGKDLAFVCDELARVRDRLSMPGLTERAKDLLKDDEHYLLRSKGDIEHAIAGLRD